MTDLTIILYLSKKYGKPYGYLEHRGSKLRAVTMFPKTYSSWYSCRVIKKGIQNDNHRQTDIFSR